MFTIILILVLITFFLLNRNRHIDICRHIYIYIVGLLGP